MTIDPNISYFRSRIPGPEIALEDVVTNNIGHLVPSNSLPSWIGCSPRIGAGMPDVLFAYYEPQILMLSKNDFSQTQLLAYLRAVNGAHLETMVIHLKYPENVLSFYLQELINLDIVKQFNGIFELSPLWKNILPTIISVEVKVNDWRRAISQAARNRLFSHKSYIALPKKTADRIKKDDLFSDLGIGLLSIDNDFVYEEIPPVKSEPQIWEYYYRLAYLLANCQGDNQLCHSTYQ
jgi:hypothetical protein